MTTVGQESNAAHKQVHRTHQMTTTPAALPVGLGPRWFSASERAHPRQTDAQKSGWQPAGCRQDSGSCERHRPGRDKFRRTRSWMSICLSDQLREYCVKVASHLFICVSGEQPKAGQPEKASFLTLPDKTDNGECLCVWHTVINNVHARPVSSPDWHHPRRRWPACSVASRTASSRL